MLDRLETAMATQRRLLADVSHQLRTPLTVARGHLEILGRTGASDPSAVQETLELVIDELDHMGGLVERLLMLGRAMEPELLELELVELAPFLVDLHEAASVLAPQRVHLDSALELSVHADANMLRGALLNLLDNAIRATRDGQVVLIGANLEPSGALRLYVEDGGEGIPPAQREAALQRFARPGARAEGGSGLGLAIAKAVALAHNGSIEIDRSPRLGGARVCIVLPAAMLLDAHRARLPELASYAPTEEP
jgi:two-component system OmpR family sensor kinase